MTPRGFSGFTALVVSLAALGGVSGCGDDSAAGDDDEDGSAGDDAGTGGSVAGGATATGGSSGGTSTGGSGLGTSTGGSGLGTGTGGSNAAGATSKGGGAAQGGTANAGAGAMGGSGGRSGPPEGNSPNSPYEVECHGDTAMCGNPNALLCLGLRIGTEVLGYSCANECQSDADCSDKPATTDAASGCVDFVKKRYCLLVCKDGEAEASCPTGMYCYVYEGTTKGYCLWH
jgi:hypothetical protein